MTTKTIDVQEAKTRLAELISLVEEGNEVILTDGSIPRARLVPLASSPSRVAGLHAGAIWTSNDFDDPLPDDFWTGGKS